MRVSKEFEKTKDLVAGLLDEDERTRNNDNLLIVQFWREQGLAVFVDEEQLMSARPAESITRCRRLIQNDPYTKNNHLGNVFGVRKERADAIRQEISHME